MSLTSMSRSLQDNFRVKIFIEILSNIHKVMMLCANWHSLGSGNKGCNIHPVISTTMTVLINYCNLLYNIHTGTYLILIGKKNNFFLCLLIISGILYTVVSCQFYQAFIVQIFFISTPLMVSRLLLWVEGKHLHHFKICYLDI